MDPRTVRSPGWKAAVEDGTAAPETTKLVSKKPNPSDVFYELVALTFDLFVAISGWMDFVNRSLRKQVTDLRLRNEAQELLSQSGPKPRTDNQAWKDKDPFPFGGTDKGALEKANKVLDYLHSFGIATDVPAGYISDKTAKLIDETRQQITVGQFNSWQNSLKNQIEQLKNDSQVETTRADGIQKSANAALDLSTAFLKTIQTAIQNAAQKI